MATVFKTVLEIFPSEEAKFGWTKVKTMKISKKGQGSWKVKL